MQASSPLIPAPSPARVLAWMAAAALVWAWAAWVGNANLDGYHDMLENYAWSQPLR